MQRKIKKAIKRSFPTQIRDFFRRIISFSTYNQHEILMKNIMRFVEFNKLKGDYLEFGVYEGDSFISAFNFANIFEKRMRFFAFDSFEGLPEIKGIDKKGVFKKGDYTATEKEFIKRLKKEKVDLSRVRIIKGFYKDSLTKSLIQREKIEKAAVIYIDCDIYSSTREVLDFITPLLQDGTIIVLEDWFMYKGNPSLGQRKAFFDWAEKNKISYSEFKIEGAYYAAFIIHKKD